MAAFTLEEDIAERVSERIRSEQAMAGDAKRVFWSVEGPTFDMRSLIRLGIWGGAATLALGMAVIAAYSSPGTQRIASAASTSQGSAQPAGSDIEMAAQEARTAENLRRVADQVHALAADREQLLTRIASLERSLDDVTGALKRDPAPNPPPAAPSAAAVPPAPAAVVPPIASAAAPTVAPAPAAVAPPPAAVPPPAPPQQEAANIPVPPPPQAAAPDPADQQTDVTTGSIPASGLGVDVGGAINFEGLRTLWFSTKRNNPDLPDELFPLVAVRENSKSHSIELRLVIGPMEDPAAAARFCTGLLASHHYCQTVAFQGQRLSLVGPASKPVSSSSHHATLEP